MASSLFLMLDDLATMLDDVAAMTKVAAGKTAGVLGDDLALNAEQVAGVVAERELPVVWAVAKGSLVNKAILVPAALAISALIPWAITPLLMIGGAFLCFEGVEKLAHKFMPSHGEEPDHQNEKAKISVHAVAANPKVDMVAFEKEKIKGAVRTDFILSAEIIVISLGTVAAAPLLQQISVLIAIAIVMTIGVYGLVAGIVKLDDAGYALRRRSNAFSRSLGQGLLAFAPFLMKALSNLGMLAMFLVGGGIVAHGIPAIAEFAHGFETKGALVATLAPLTLNLIVGFATGAVVYGIVTLAKKLRPEKA